MNLNGALDLSGYLDLHKFELKNGAIHKSATDIATPVLGQIYFNTVSNRLRTFNGTTWDESGSGSGDVVGPAGGTTSGQTATFSSTTGKLIGGYTQGVAGIVKSSTGGVLSQATVGSDYSVGTAALATGLLKSTTTTGALSIAVAGDIPNIAESQVTSLVSDLAAKAPLASPTLTGVPLAPTAAALNNTTQIATTAYVDAATTAIVASTDAMVFKGVIDCSANPNYPAANAGWTYKVSVAGKIGGASGVNVEVGDTLLCTTDGTASGNQATVGSAWYIAQTNLEAATTSLAGFVSLATLAEAEAGTVTTKAVTPASIVNFPRVYSGLVGNGSLGTAVGTPIVVTHTLGLADRDAFTINLVNVSTHAVELCEVVSVDANSLNLYGWAVAPTTNAYRVTVTG